MTGQDGTEGEGLALPLPRALLRVLADPGRGLRELERLDCEAGLLGFTRHAWRLLEPGRAGGRGQCEEREGERADETADVTHWRRWGTSSDSNHGFFLNQPLLRQEGCGSGMIRP